MAGSQTALLITFIYVLILLLILIIDLRQRRILNIVILPATGLALVVGWLGGRESFFSTLLGALAGFIFFYLLYWWGRKRFGPGALGFGDVKLAALLGALLGIPAVWPALLLGMLAAGLSGLLLLLGGRAGLRSSLPYGAFLAGAGMVVLVGQAIGLI
jgi:leader peptidase (prepilin peptidase)/N-methyltransferase